MPTLDLRIDYEAEQLPDDTELTRDRRETLQKIASYVGALAGGHRQGTVRMLTNDGNGVAATAEVEYDGSSGTTNVVINGVTFSQASGTDDARAAAAAAAINASANALISGVVTASYSANVLTLRAVEKTKAGNANTLSVSGTGVSASGARFTGGVTATDATTATI
jgi:phage tail sheath gpL-like